MSYRASVLNVLIASPSDVDDERNMAKKILLNWNDVNSTTKQIVLMPRMWEQNVAPEIADRPQDVVSNKILKDADILVGIFWTRIGTPTGKAISGSVEEIEEHISAKKLTMLYFSNKPIEPNKIDKDQYQAVLDIKLKYQQKGIIHSFSSIDDFERHFSNHVAIKLNDIYIQQIQSNSTFSVEQATKISSDALELLNEACQDTSGQIIHIGYAGGFEISTNNKNFVQSYDARSVARWKSALNELEREELVETSNGQIYNVTYKGFQLLK